VVVDREHESSEPMDDPEIRFDPREKRVRRDPSGQDAKIVPTPEQRFPGSAVHVDHQMAAWSRDGDKAAQRFLRIGVC